MGRTIHVTGEGRLTIPPDQVEVMISLSGSHRNYEKLIAMSSKETAAVRECFSSLDIDTSEVKTTHFHIAPDYDYSGRKRTFNGYKYSHELLYKMDVDDEKLGKILGLLTDCSAEPSFQLRYSVKDVDAVKKELLKVAVKDAIEKAEIITSAAGVELGEIIDIGRSSMDVNFMFRAHSFGAREQIDKPLMADLPMGEPMAAPPDIQAEDIEIEDEIEIVWSIR